MPRQERRNWYTRKEGYVEFPHRVNLYPRHMLSSSTLQVRGLEAKQKANEKQNIWFQLTHGTEDKK